MDLVKAGETAKVEILGEPFEIEVMSVFDAEEWGRANTGEGISNIDFIKALCGKIKSIGDGSIEPVEVLKKLRKSDDLLEIFKAIVHAGDLDDTEAKNSNSSPEQVTTNSLENVETTVGGEKSPVSTTPKPEFQ